MMRDDLFSLPLRLDTRAVPMFTLDQVLAAARRAVANRRTFKMNATRDYNRDMIPDYEDFMRDELTRSK